MIKGKIKVLLLPMAVLLMNSCGKENDYSSVTYRNYLRYEIAKDRAFLSDQAEGTDEGLYNAGSMQVYSDAIDAADAVCSDSTTVQKEIDRAYGELLQAEEDFYDRMVPFKTAFAELIADADFSLGYYTEGDQEGNAMPGTAAVLSAVTEDARTALNDPALIQRTIDDRTAKLLSALYTFDGKIIGKAHLYITNPGFEQPGTETSDFSTVPGWMLFGKVEDWAPPAEIYKGGSALLPAESVPEGEFVIRLGSYTQGIYQDLNERIHPNVRYNLSFNAAILENYPDAFNKSYKVVVQSRVLVFEKEAGDYRFAGIISQSYDTLGLVPAGFTELSHNIDIDAASPYLDRKFAVDFLVRHTFDTAKPLWAEAYVAIDGVRITRKPN